MAYSDQKFYDRPCQAIAFGTNLGTGTYGSNGAVVTSSAVCQLPQYFRKTVINNVRMICTVAANSTNGTLAAVFLNGTSTFATVALASCTAGQVLTGVMTLASATFSANAGPTVNVVGTGTSSANGVFGSYNIYFEEQEQPT
jgi:hypothetical protein